MSKQRGPTGFRSAGDAREFPLVDYLLLAWIGSLLQALGVRKSNRFTLLHRRVARHDKLNYEDLRAALFTATATWCITCIISVVFAVAFGLAARIFEGLHLNAATLGIFFLLFLPCGLSIPLMFLSIVRLQSLDVSGRIRKPVSDDVKVRRYRPKQWDFWASTGLIAAIAVLMAVQL
jgi:hypothetical protein